MNSTPDHFKYLATEFFRFETYVTKHIDFFLAIIIALRYLLFDIFKQISKHLHSAWSQWHGRAHHSESYTVMWFFLYIRASHYDLLCCLCKKRLWRTSFLVPTQPHSHSMSHRTIRCVNVFKSVLTLFPRKR